jgi:hypothetical protein
MNATLSGRRRFFDSKNEPSDEQKVKLSQKETRFTCPCCGYPTLGERGAYEICELCWWEDDGQDDSDAGEIRGGPNHKYSLTEARHNFEQYLIMYPPEEDPRIGGADSKESEQLKHTLIAAFDKMISASQVEELNALWQEVYRLEKALRKELKAKIREYEAKLAK